MPRTRTILLALTLVLFLSLASTASAGELQRGLDDVVAAGAPGAVVLVSDDGRTTTAASGRFHSGGRYRIGSMTFRMGSMTKTFVATVVLQLAGEQRLRLSDTVEQWLPGVLPYGDDVTIEQLLNHTGGVPDNIFPLIAGLFGDDRFRTWQPAELLAIGASRPRSEPGKWVYSNTDYVLLGMIVERVTGRSLRDQLMRRIVRPLGLHDTSFPYRSPAIPGRHAHGYSLPVDENLQPIAGPLVDMTRFNPSLAWGAGNGVSSVSDLARFWRALLGGRLLGPHRLAELKSGVETGQPGLRYGLGVYIWETRCGTLIGNEGDILGFSNVVMSNEDGSHLAVVMVNLKLAPEAVGDALDRVLDLATCG
jgi:D-alanyl-D-alanine carboxypeptidase